MGVFTKNKKEPEPQYYTSATNMKTMNYKVYHMGVGEKTVTFLIAFVVAACVGYLFYGGIGVDEYGNPTTLTWILNISIPSILGIIAGRFFIPLREEQIIKKRKKNLRLQFRDMLDSLNTSIGSGKNVPESMIAVYDDLKVQYDEDADIIHEMEVILSGLHNNVDIEDMLLDFGKRSGIDDIISFANVFKISYRKGGNLKDIIRNTHSILSDKMEIEDDIETLVSSNKLEQNIMIVMPIALIAIIKMMSADFAKNFVTATGIVSTTLAIIMFVVAYIIGKKVLDINV